MELQGLLRELPYNEELQNIYLYYLIHTDQNNWALYYWNRHYNDEGQSMISFESSFQYFLVYLWMENDVILSEDLQVFRFISPLKREMELLDLILTFCNILVLLSS